MVADAAVAEAGVDGPLLCWLVPPRVLEGVLLLDRCALAANAGGKSGRSGCNVVARTSRLASRPGARLLKCFCRCSAVRERGDALLTKEVFIPGPLLPQVLEQDLVPQPEVLERTLPSHKPYNTMLWRPRQPRIDLLAVDDSSGGRLHCIRHRILSCY